MNDHATLRRDVDSIAELTLAQSAMIRAQHQAIAALAKAFVALAQDHAELRRHVHGKTASETTAALPDWLTAAMRRDR